MDINISIKVKFLHNDAERREALVSKLVELDFTTLTADVFHSSESLEGCEWVDCLNVFPFSLSRPATSGIRMKQPRMRHFGDETAHEGDLIQMSSTFQINRLIQ